MTDYDMNVVFNDTKIINNSNDNDFIEADLGGMSYNRRSYKMSQPQPWARDQGKGLQECGPRQKPGSVGECEDEYSHSQMNFHCVWELKSRWTPKTSKSDWKGAKPLSLKSFLHHWKVIEAQMPKMGSHDPFGHLQHKLWPK